MKTKSTKIVWKLTDSLSEIRAEVLLEASKADGDLAQLEELAVAFDALREADRLASRALLEIYEQRRTGNPR